jgi:pimeloyl-ACP methyl ester carboxylesterase
MTAEPGSWRAEGLGEQKEVELPQGTLLYHEAGSGPPAVFVHGALVNANLWRKVVPELAGEMRCVSLDLPFGAHLRPMPPDADLSPPGIADLIADAIEALGLDEVTLVGNDTATAFCQIVAARRPERIGRLVLTSGDAFENFPPTVLKPVTVIARVPGAITGLLAPLRLAPARRAFFRSVAKRPLEAEVAESYARPWMSDAGVRRDLAKLLVGAHKRHTLDAAERLREFDRPALVAWSRDDQFFPAKHAERLAELLPDARLEWIEDSRTFSAEDQPERLAGLIREFVASTAATTGAAAS